MFKKEENVELFVQKSWQSFSTMRKFVQESHRLENISWRLWFLQSTANDRHPLPLVSNPPSTVGVRCVYCELKAAVLSCHGCCHDAYCVSCFKLLHKKGQLSAHTAKALPTTTTTTTTTTAQQSPPPQQLVSPPSVVVVPSSSLSFERGAEIPPRVGSKKVKDWELEMDKLIQNLMLRSLPQENDISVHNIDYASSPEVKLSTVPTFNAADSTDNSFVNEKESPVDENERRNPVGKSKKKKLKCGNCSGGHITISCPLLSPDMDSTVTTSSSGNSSSGSLFSSNRPKSESVDTRLRKFFTTLHNSNMSNSTHAYLGDDISVHGSNEYALNSKNNSISRPIASIREEKVELGFSSCRICCGKKSILPSVEKQSIYEDKNWDPNSWIMACLVAQLPDELFQPLDLSIHDKKISARCSNEKINWCNHHRFFIYRNYVVEYRLEDSSPEMCKSRPVGLVNLSDGRVSIVENIVSLVVYKAAVRDKGTHEYQFQLDTPLLAQQWYTEIQEGISLGIDNLFDLNPKSSPDQSCLELGKGRFSVVRKAQCKKSKNDVALKIIDKNSFWSLVEQEVERRDTIFREVLTQGLLSLNNSKSPLCPVVQLLSIYETHEMLVLELELMQGGDLFDLIDRQQDIITEPFAAKLIAELVYAIIFCQQHQVAHRDVKLSNLALVTEFDTLKLADFGMAAFIQPDGKLKGRCGTPGFVAPEILLAGKREAYPGYVDMFSVGVVLYTLLCGYEPFYGVTDQELILANKEAEVVFHDPEWTHISSEAKDLVKKMMEKDTTKRIQPKQALEHSFLREAVCSIEKTKPQKAKNTICHLLPHL